MIEGLSAAKNISTLRVEEGHMAKEFTTKAQEAIASALQSVQVTGNPQAMPIHLLEALLEQKEGIATALVDAAGVDRSAVGARTCNAFVALSSTSGASASQAQTARAPLGVVDQARSLADKDRDAYVSTKHLLTVLAALKDEVGRIFPDVGATPEALSEALARLRPGVITSIDPEESFETLKKYGCDLMEVTHEGRPDPAIGRDAGIRRVVQVLSRRTRSNPVLIGEPGVGRTAVVEGLVQCIVAGDIPESLRDKILIAPDLPAMVTDAKYRGEFEERLRAIFAKIQRSDGQIIIFVGELHAVVGAGAGSEGATDAGNMLKPTLA